MSRRVQKAMLGILGTLCGLAQAPAAKAQAGATLVFDWAAPEGCPPAKDVSDQIDGLLGGPANDRMRGDLVVRATVERHALWQVTLRTTSGESSGHRTIEAATCGGLANATALIVALMIDPDAVAARANRPTESDRKFQAPVPTVSESAPPSPPTPRTTFGLIGMGAVGSLGVLPAAGLGLAGHVGLVRRSWRVDLRFAYGPWGTRSDPLDNRPGVYGEFRFHAAMLAACRTWSRAGIEWGPCAGVEAGMVQGKGVGANQSTAENTPWFGLGAGGLLLFKPTRWLRLPLRADAVVPLWRPDFVFRDVETRPIFRSWALGARLALSAEMQF